MYIRVTNPKFLELGDSGRPAAGYLVYTLVAGTVDTLLTTYSNKGLTSANTNPIVLDARGECDIFTSGDVKLVYTSPTGTLSSPIWTEDYVAEQQGVVSDRGNGVYIGNNYYTLDIVPTYTNISDGFSLVMVPDTTCLGTLVIPVGATVPTVFTGTGINDGTFSGRYIGATAGAVFAATIDTLYLNAPSAPTIAENVAVGLVTVGNHSVKITAVTAEGETEPSAASNVVSAAGARKLDVTGIPAIGGTVTGYNIYMNKAGGTTWYFVALVTAITYTISVADASLTVVAPTANTTGSGAGADTFSWQIDAGAVTAGVPITGAVQTLQDGISITFANRTGHTLADAWTVEVMTPVRLNFCSLGNKLIYKNEDGALAVLDAADMIANYPAHLDYSLAENCWILLNPSLPVLTNIIPTRTRKEVTGNYTIDEVADQGTEINVTGTFTVTLPDAVDAASRFFYIRNNGPGVVTVDAGTYLIKDTLNTVGATTITLGLGQAIQIATNGVDWHVLSGTGLPVLLDTVDLTADATHTFTDLFPGFVYKLEYELTSSNNARVSVRFNADSGNNYVGQSSYIDQTGVSAADITLISSVMLHYSPAGTTSIGECKFKTLTGDDTNVTVLGMSHGAATAGLANYTCGGNYNGAADLSSVTILTDAGTLTGRVNLYRVA